MAAPTQPSSQVPETVETEPSRLTPGLDETDIDRIVSRQLRTLDLDYEATQAGRSSKSEERDIVATESAGADARSPDAESQSNHSKGEDDSPLHDGYAPLDDGYAPLDGGDDLFGTPSTAPSSPEVDDDTDHAINPDGRGPQFSDATGVNGPKPDCEEIGEALLRPGPGAFAGMEEEWGGFVGYTEATTNGSSNGGFDSAVVSGVGDGTSSGARSQTQSLGAETTPAAPEDQKHRLPETYDAATEQLIRETMGRIQPKNPSRFFASRSDEQLLAMLSKRV